MDQGQGVTTCSLQGCSSRSQVQQGQLGTNSLRDYISLPLLHTLSLQSGEDTRHMCST